MPRDTHTPKTGSWEGASWATLASPGSSVESLSGDIPSLQCFLIANLIYLSPGSLRLNITQATTHELILLPGSRTVLSRTVQKKHPGNFLWFHGVFITFPAITEK